MSLPIVGVLAAFFGLGFGGFRSFQHGIQADVAGRIVGEDKQVSIRVSGDLGMLQGNLRRVTISASRFESAELPFFVERTGPSDGVVRKLSLKLSDFRIAGLHVHELDAEIPDCRFDVETAIRHRRIRLRKSGTGTGSVVVDESALLAFLRAKFPTFEFDRVRLSDGRATVEGRGRLLMLAAGFTIDASVEASDTKLMLTDARIRLGNNLANAAEISLLVGLFNPVLDLDKDLRMHGAVRIEKLSIEAGRMRAEGAMIVPDRPAPKVTSSEPHA